MAETLAVSLAETNSMEAVPEEGYPTGAALVAGRLRRELTSVSGCPLVPSR